MNEYDYGTFMKGIDGIFKYVEDGKPKSVICGRCATMVTTGKDTDCKCGYIGKLMDHILEKK